MGWSDSVYFLQPTRDEEIVTQVGPAFWMNFHELVVFHPKNPA